MNYDTPSIGGALIFIKGYPLEMNQGLGKANPRPWIKRLKEQLLIVEQHVDELCHVLDGDVAITVDVGSIGIDAGITTQ